MKTVKKALQNINDKQALNLPALENWTETVHVFDEKSLWAIRAAIASGRPLLVRGEPGTGKSQLARAAAHVLKRKFIHTVITSRTEGLDLLWRFDAVARLFDAQCGKTSDIDESNYIVPGPVWRALNPKTAFIQLEKYNKKKTSDCNEFKSDEYTNGTVLLIDEIDKADSDLPNSLLEVLGQSRFQIPQTGMCIDNDNSIAPPLVIITTNEDRELPWAFVRRCMVHHLKLPKDNKSLKEYLVNIGAAHFSKIPVKIRIETADILITDRLEMDSEDSAKPGQAEYLDILRAVNNLVKNDDSDYTEKDILDASNVLKEINKFALDKKLLEAQ